MFDERRAIFGRVNQDMLNAKQRIGNCNLLFITLDTLRFDVADMALKTGKTPQLARFLPQSGWELRHSPGSFTYAAHQSFFAGFLPTPIGPGPHPRLFAAKFPGSETTGAETFVFEAADIVTGLRQIDYHTICIGGVGFFNKLTPLGSALPRLFDESHWDESLGVTDRNSTANQVDLAIERLQLLGPSKKYFLFLNVSALHQPNCIYLDGAETDSIETQLAALQYVDGELARLLEHCQQSPTMCIITSDHGTAYGEDGYVGHLRLTSSGMERSDAIGPWLYSNRVASLMEQYEWS